MGGGGVKRAGKAVLAGAAVLSMVAAALMAAVPLALADPSGGDGAPAPSARQWTQAVYDSRADRIILFGGGVYVGTNDTWAFDTDTNTWELRHPPAAPPARMGHGMVYDEEADRVIMFGGVTAWVALCNGYPSELGAVQAASLGDTWAYDFENDTWTDLAPPIHPAPRSQMAMAYDAGSDKVVLYGGAAGGIGPHDTWTYDYAQNNWTFMNTPDPAPPQAQIWTAAYDPSLGATVIFGGFAQNGGGTDTTWSYDSQDNRWSRTATSVHPPASDGVQMTYDSVNNRTVVFGGYSWAPQKTRADLWWLDLTTMNWTEQPQADPPEDRVGAAFAFDSQTGAALLFGGIRYTEGDPGCFDMVEWTVLGSWSVFDAASNAWAPMGKPPPPSGVHLSVGAADPHRGRADVDVSWTTAAVPGPAKFRGSNVYRLTSAGNWDLVGALVQGTSFTDARAAANAPECGRDYTYAVSTVSQFGEGPRSANQTVEVPACPVPPPGVAGGDSLVWGALLALTVVAIASYVRWRSRR
jgi:hypothetical protein